MPKFLIPIYCLLRGFCALIPYFCTAFRPPNDRIMSTIAEEIKKRKTFAIISHPDAGKTTLTEKFLLYGGAIQTAGAVKSNKIKKSATSDFMEIEKQRGISVATSVMTFDYQIGRASCRERSSPV